VTGAVALLTTAALVAPSTAYSAGVVSQARGQLLQASVIGADLANLVSLDGAVAANDGSVPTVVNDTPISLSVLQNLQVLQIGTNTLLGNNGILKLGALGQFAQANADGSSNAFAGLVSSAPSVLGIGTTYTVTPSQTIDPPTGNSVAELTLGNLDTDPVALKITLGALDASAHQDPNGAQSGQYTLADASITIGGTLLAGLISTLNGILAPVVAAATSVGISVPVQLTTPNTITLDLGDLVRVTGTKWYTEGPAPIADINSMPPNTDLLAFIPRGIVVQANTLITGTLTLIAQAAQALGILGTAVTAAVDIANAAVDAVWSTFQTFIGNPITMAIAAVANITANAQARSAGSFTETALQINLLGGIAAQINLANATVGPNRPAEAVSIANRTTVAIASLVLLGAGGAILLRRRSTRQVAG
jgi:hypothetical protein